MRLHLLLGSTAGRIRVQAAGQRHLRPGHTGDSRRPGDMDDGAECPAGPGGQGPVRPAVHRPAHRQCGGTARYGPDDPRREPARHVRGGSAPDRLARSTAHRVRPRRSRPHRRAGALPGLRRRADGLRAGSGAGARVRTVADRDDYAVSVLSTLAAESVRTPDDIAVVGFDDRDDLLPGGAVESTHDTGFESAADDVETRAQRRALDLNILSLTTVRVPFDELGRLALEVLLDLIRGAPVQPVSEVDTELKVRRTC